MHQEATHIFSENIWVGVHMNEKGIAQDLKNRGYNVQTEGRKHKDNVKRALDITIDFDNDPGRQLDSFLVSLSAIAQFARAVQGLHGIEYLCISFSIQPEFRGKFTQDSEIIAAFRPIHVWGVKVHEDDYVFEELAFAMSVELFDYIEAAPGLWDPHPGMDEIMKKTMCQLQAKFLAAQEACSEGQ